MMPDPSTDGTRANDEAAEHGASTFQPLRIEGEMTLHRAAELHSTLIAEVQRRASPVEIDLSGVNDIDTAGVQLLLLAKRTASAQNKELQLVQQSSAVLQALELLNLSTYLGPPAFSLF
jgi:anti-sigma B factor antagonist